MLTDSELLQLRMRRYEMLKHAKAIKVEADNIKVELIRASLERLAAQPSVLEEGEEPPVIPEAEEAETSGWNCPDPRNAYKHCIYNDEEDPCHDDCLFCHQPEERQ